MAIDFNATTSKLEHTTADLSITTVATICAWTFADGQGEASLGGIINLNESPNSLILRHDNSDNTLGFYAFWTGTDGQWTFPAPDAQWNAVAVSYDGGAITNDPVARVNFADVTETEVSTPTLAFTAPSTGYCVGSNTATTRTWNGMLAHVQVFNAILTAREMDQALRRPGSVRRGLKLWLPMYHAAYLADLSGAALNGTGANLADRVGGPPIAPLFAGVPYSPYAVAVGGGGSILRQMMNHYYGGPS